MSAAGSEGSSAATFGRNSDVEDKREFYVVATWRSVRRARSRWLGGYGPHRFVGGPQERFEDGAASRSGRSRAEQQPLHARVHAQDATQPKREAGGAGPGE